jgi:drug/metabolite transporter (DMT)-like permease
LPLISNHQEENYFRILASAGATNVLLVTFLIPVSAVLLGIGVLGEVIHVLEYVGMGCISLGLIVIDGRALKWIRGNQCHTDSPYLGLDQ